MTMPKPLDLGPDPRLQYPAYRKLPRVRAWTETVRGELFLCEIRKDPRTGMVLKGRFSMRVDGYTGS